MATARRMRFVRGQVAWMVATVLGLALLGALSYELFFLLSFLGFLVVTGLTTPFNVTPAWRARLKWLILAGLLVVGYVVVRRILEILPPGVLP
jgi:hypothetical protein